MDDQAAVAEPAVPDTAEPLSGAVVGADVARQHMPLNRDQILKSEDLDSEWVLVPEWDGEVLVKALSGKDRDNYESSCMSERPVLDAKGKPIRGRTEMVRSLANVRAKLVVRCLVNDDGSRMFTDADANALGEKSAAALDRLFEVAARLSRLSDEDIEDLAGNSEAAQSGSSTTGSPETSDAAP